MQTPKRQYTDKLHNLTETLRLPNGDPKGTRGIHVMELHKINMAKLRNLQSMTNSQKANSLKANSLKANSRKAKSLKAKVSLLEQLKATGDPAHTGRIAQLEAALRGNSNIGKRPYYGTIKNRITNKNFTPRGSSPLAGNAFDEANKALEKLLKEMGLP
jgi:hypothetical protein